MHAARWSGTADSWIDLHPAGVDGSSMALSTCGDIQVGSCGYSHASLWKGTPESRVDLHAFLPGPAWMWGSSIARSVSRVGDSVYVAGSGYNSSLGRHVALLWVGTVPAGCFGNIDGSDGVDLGDVALVLLDFGPCVGCPADIDGSGEVDFGDVALILLGTGPCS